MEHHHESQHPRPERSSRHSPEMQLLRAEIIERLPTTPGGKLSERAHHEGAGLMRGCLDGHRSGDGLSPGHARQAARLLSTAVETPHSYLEDFSNGIKVPYEAVRTEYLELQGRRTIYPTAREVINWMANYFLARRLPELRPSLLPEDEDHWRHQIIYKRALGLTAVVHACSIDGMLHDPRILDHIERFALAHGTPGLAYLRLPTTNAAHLDIHEMFTNAYFGSYDDITTLLDTLAPLHQEGQPRDGPPKHADLTEDEQAQLRANAGSQWIATEAWGQVHLFARPTSHSGRLTWIPPNS